MIQLQCRNFRKAEVVPSDFDCCEFCHETESNVCGLIDTCRIIDNEEVWAETCCSFTVEIRNLSDEDWKKAIKHKKGN